METRSSSKKLKTIEDKEDTESGDENEENETEPESEKEEEEAESGGENEENETEMENDENGERSAQTRSSVINDGRVKCTQCQKTYSKISNLNTHIKIVHRFNRWVCPQPKCLQQCATKQSLKRHIERKHSSLNTKKGNRKRSCQLNEYEYFGEGELSDSAKLAKIKRLDQELRSKESEIKALKEKNLKLQQENEQLKALNQ